MAFSLLNAPLVLVTLSGGPVIDENTGYAVGVHNSRLVNESGDSGKGTSAWNTSFWYAYQAEQNSFTKHITQKRESGQTLSGSAIGRWDMANDEFDNYTLTGSSISFNVWEGNAEVLRADQDVYNSPKEKYNRWEGISDVYNHRPIQMIPSGTPLTSQFKKAHSNITVTTKFPEYSSSNGSGNIEFKDPWLIDYADPDFDNEMRNRGMDAEFYSHPAPFTPGFSSINGKLYNGLFLDENENFLPNLPNYSVRAQSQTFNFGGNLGNREAIFAGWEGDDADFENPNEHETAVVFTNAGAEARAKMKVRGLSDENIWRANQRKAIRSSDGWQHLVYESMGHVWYEAKAPSGSWSFVETGGRMHVDTGGGKSPSIAFSHPNANLNWDYMTAVAWQEGSDIHVRTYYNDNGQYYAGNSIPWPIDSGASESYNTEPQVIWTDNNEFMVAWRNSSGIHYKFYTFNGMAPTASNQPSGTINGSSGGHSFAVDSYTVDGSIAAFDVAWLKGTGFIGPPYYTGTEVYFASMQYDAIGSVTQYSGFPVKISNPSVYRNREPSVVSMPATARVGWVASTDEHWDSWSTSATLATIDLGSSQPAVSRSTLDHHVESVSLSKRSDHSEFYVAWSQIYDQQGWNDYNKFAEGSALSTFKSVNTDGWEVQLEEGDTPQDMHIMAYYSKSMPYYWETSNAIGTQLKAAPLTASEGRSLTLADSSTGFRISLEKLFVGEQPIEFRDLEPIAAEHQKAARYEGARTPTAGTSTREVQPYLRSRSFPISSEEHLRFTESFVAGDSAALASLWGKQHSIAYDILLKEEGTGNLLATLATHSVHSPEALASHTQSWKIDTSRLPETRAYVELVPTVTISGLLASVETHYSDDYKRLAAKKQKEDVREVVPAKPVTEYSLAQNYPNPFNPSTVISYQLPENTMVRLEVFDLLGRKVATLVNERQSTGKYSVRFNAGHLASGVYLYRLQAGEFVQSKKLFLIK